MIKSVKIKFTKYVAETPKAYLVKYNYSEVWLPKSLCRNFAVHGNDMHGVAEITSFLFEKITGVNPNETDKDLCDYNAVPSWTIEKHVPERIEPKEIQADANLIK
ncbi:MAG: hypothetical protein JXR34_11605 [Bacteroidales bacterium]|nr:hypothetical protein [Bacteroidales bacterium]